MVDLDVVGMSGDAVGVVDEQDVGVFLGEDRGELGRGRLGVGEVEAGQVLVAGGPGLPEGVNKRV